MPKTVQSVAIEGNKRSHSSYLRRFLQVQPGERFDSLTMENDLRRLRSLAGVMHATARVTTVDSGVAINYHIDERITILPVGDFGLTRENFWIGAGAMESNLAGRGIYLYGFYRYNTYHTFHTIFRIPYIRGSNWGAELQFRNLPAVETTTREQEVLNLFRELSVAAKHEFRYEHELRGGVSYREQGYDYTGIVSSMPDTLSDRRKSMVAFSTWDIGHLNYYDFYLGGWENTLHFETAFPIRGGTTIIWVFYNELSYYKRLGRKGNLASRFLMGGSNEEHLLYSPFVADSYYNFRGIGYRVDRGSGVGIINLEYRQTCYENAWGGIQMIIFSDSGAIRKAGIGEVSPAYKAFAGLGLRFIYKKAYNAILSIDYGMNLREVAPGGWVIGWGQYF